MDDRIKLAKRKLNPLGIFPPVGAVVCRTGLLGLGVGLCGQEQCKVCCSPGQRGYYPNRGLHRAMD